MQNAECFRPTLLPTSHYLQLILYMEYNFRAIEQKWQQQWNESGAYKISNESSKPKYYVLDMFPYPSGAGLHVGHPLGYIASDIYARYKRLKGFNVLHPMGYDAFGLPAEQYALEHGVHPAVSTAQNIKNFRSQLDKIGFSFDWSREVNTSDPKYYKWTQWIFLQLFKSWFNRQTAKAEPIETLQNLFKQSGNKEHPIPNAHAQISNEWKTFDANQWNSFDEKVQQAILMEYRLAYCGYGEVNWCEALGTVLANDEVINGVSERGGYPVVKKKLRQWYLRITEYADRLLGGLSTVDFSDAMKEMQTNWIGKSSGAEIVFRLTPDLSQVELERGEGQPAAFDSQLNVAEEPYPKYGIENKVQFDNARLNRKESTEAEAKLWEQLRDSKVGCKFRRQHPAENYIVDFACLQKGLIVEVDGGYHNNEEQRKYDEDRTKHLEQKGFTILRFTNEEVLANVYAVRDKIKEAIAKLPEKGAIHNETTNINGPSPLSSFAGEGPGVRCYTTRPDTIFGVDFLVIAPEHELVDTITTSNQKAAVEEYITYVKSRSERERMAEKKITGVFTGAYATNPFDDEKKIPIWISEYVLAGYGTGAIMAVPCGDERDHKFAREFNLPITNIVGDYYNGEEANPTKEAILQNSGFLNGVKMKDASEIVINKLEELGIGKRKVNYKMRDAAFSRQRYWGEPFPIKWIDGIAYPLDEKELPLELPYVEGYKAGPEGEGPLANLKEWSHLPALSGEGSGVRETNTMPGYAGSSWYFLRYMDPHNEEAFCDKKVSDYWGQVDLYVGGTEHAVGHLLYSRLWTKILFDLGHIRHDEPYKRLLNQGMIQGRSSIAYRFTFSAIYYEDGKIMLPEDYPFNSFFLSREIYEFINRDYIINLQNFLDNYFDAYYVRRVSTIAEPSIQKIHIPIDCVDVNDKLDVAKLRSRTGFKNSEFISKTKDFICDSEVEKMSKRWLNVVNPDDVVEKYGADTFRMYEMFLGPVEMSKPWDTKGIEGVHRFLKKLWRMFVDDKGLIVTDEAPTAAELKILHKTIKKIEEDTERFSFNTTVSAYMVCVNELMDLKSHKREILEPLLVTLTPYAPHIAEELWHILGNESSILDASFPTFDPKHLVESAKEYPISINGKMRTQIVIDLNADQKAIEDIVLQNAVVQKWLEGKSPKKIIYVKGKMVNVVI